MGFYTQKLFETFVLKIEKNAFKVKNSLHTQHKFFTNYEQSFYLKKKFKVHIRTTKIY